MAFHININEEFDGLEAGYLNKDIHGNKNGYWTYEDRKTELQKDDIVYYWIYYIYNNLGYNIIDQKHQVSGNKLSNKILNSKSALK